MRGRSLPRSTGGAARIASCDEAAGARSRLVSGGFTAVVIGAGGGIGRALVAALDRNNPGERVYALSRRPSATNRASVRLGVIDIADEESIRAAVAAIDRPLDRVIVATGLLHDQDYAPERALRDLAPAALAHVFAINTIGPALVLKHFAPLMARDRPSVLALLSARVGSISDNRTGGWYGYRASKAALNMIVRSAAIELARSRPLCACVALHPGTVDTGLSKPFQARVPAERLFTPDHAAHRLLEVIDGLAPAQSGRCFAWDGTEILP